MAKPIMLLALLSPLALPLVGCSSDKEGTTISFNATDSDGNITAGMDGNSGEVSINAPGFSGKFSLPKMTLGAGDFSLNGVKLYPGSTITSMNIAAGNREDGGEDGGKDSGKVRVAFDSPADPDKVVEYFAQKLGNAGFTLARKGTRLTGTDDEKKPFTLAIQPAAAGHSTGVITVGE